MEKKELEAEIVKLKTQLYDAENKISEMKERLAQMGVKLYGGNRN